MTRSHARRALAPVLVVSALALAACGSDGDAGGGTAPSTADAGASSAPSASASPTPSPSPVRAAGLDDPATGLEGSAEKGDCSWITPEQVEILGFDPPTGDVEGSLSTGTGAQGSQVRRCFTSLGKEAGILVGQGEFDSAADADAFEAATPAEATTPVDGYERGSFGVFLSPSGKSTDQSIVVIDGTTYGYVTVSVLGEKPTTVDGKTTPTIDRRPALEEIYRQIFG